MIDYIEALEAVHKFKTTGRAATALRLSQSAVSKRLSSLENLTGKSLLEKRGRYLHLTIEGQRLLEKIQGPLREIKSIIHSEPVESHLAVAIGVTESILLSWGAEVLRHLYGEVSLEVHAHRGSTIVDHVLSSRYQLGLCAGYCGKAHELKVVELGFEPMVLICKNENLPLACIEKSSETWPAIERQIMRKGIVVDYRLESFACIAKLASKGLMRGIVPLGVAQSLRLKGQSLGIRRPIIAIGRKSFWEQRNNKVFIDKFLEETKRGLSLL